MDSNLLKINNIAQDEDLLVKDLLRNDQYAFNYLYINYSAALLRIILKIVKNEEEAQDVLQEVFVLISRNISLYDNNKGRLFTWMARLCRNKAIDNIRSFKKKYDHKLSDMELLTMAADKRHFISYNVDIIGVRQLVFNLTVLQKEIINLIYFHGYTHTEVANELGIPLGTVKTRKTSAILSLRKHFN